MTYYRNSSGRSGVLSYEETPNGIIIQFRDGGVYEYTTSSTSTTHIANMKKLAKVGAKLNTYINKYVKYKYSNRIR